MTKKTETNTIPYAAIVGGDIEAPVMVSEARQVTVAALAEGANATALLALNFLLDNVAHELTTDIGLDKAFPRRSAKNDKGATKYLIGCSVADIRRAWDEDLLNRKRYTEPTLQKLASLVKAMKKDPAPKAPTLAQQVADILTEAMAPGKKLAAIAKLAAIEKALKS